MCYNGKYSGFVMHAGWRHIGEKYERCITYFEQLYNDSRAAGIMGDARFQCSSAKENDKGNPYRDTSYIHGGAVLGDRAIYQRDWLPELDQDNTYTDDIPASSRDHAGHNGYGGICG